MKLVYFLLLLFLLMINAPAQSLNNSTDTGSADIAVLEKQWRADFYNPAFDRSPYSGLEEMQQAKIDRQQTRKENQARARRGQAAKLPPVRVPADNDSPKRESSVTYIYKIKIRNTGQKTIQTVSWDYVFFEPETEKEVGRQQFISQVNLRPGKTKEIIMGSYSPPTETIDAKNAGKKAHELYTERIIIVSIEYEDSTVWENPSETVN